MPKRLRSWSQIQYAKSQQRPTAAKRGYCSASWRRIRLQVIARDKSQCRLCGRLVAGKDAHVDHIIEKPHGSDNVSNLRLLCVSCHSRRTASRADDRT